MKKGKFLATLSIAALLALTSCGGSQPEQSEVDKAIHAIYTLYADSTENAKSYEEWLAEIKGPKGDKGDKGADGSVVTIGENGNWFIDGVDTNVHAQGQKGDAGTPGTPGTNGTNGVDGETPHIGDNGHWFIGTTDTGVVAQGQNGAAGETPHIDETTGHWFVGTTDTGVVAQGPKGDQGAQGPQGDKGDQGVSVVDVKVKTISGINNSVVYVFTFVMSDGSSITRVTTSNFDYTDYSLTEIDEDGYPHLVAGNEDYPDLVLDEKADPSFPVVPATENSLADYLRVGALDGNQYPFRWNAEEGGYLSTNQDQDGKDSVIVFTAVAAGKISLDLTTSGEGKWDYAKNELSEGATMTVGANSEGTFDASKFGDANKTTTTYHHEIDLAANSTVTYIFHKDGSGKAGMDGALLKNVKFLPDGMTADKNDFAVVNFNSLGGQFVNPEVVRKGGLLTNLPTPNSNNERKSFAGWFTDGACKNAFDPAATVIERDLVLYAGYNDVYKVTVHFNNGEDNSVLNVVNGDTVELERPNKSGFTFAGWYSNEGLTKEYDLSTPVAGDLDLYAKWDVAPEYCKSYSRGSNIYNASSSIYGTKTLTIDENGNVTSDAKYNNMKVAYYDKAKGLIAMNSSGEVTVSESGTGSPSAHWGYFFDGNLLLTENLTYSITGISNGFYLFTSNEPAEEFAQKTNAFATGSSTYSPSYIYRVFNYIDANGAERIGFYHSNGSLHLNVTVKNADGEDLTLGSNGTAATTGTVIIKNTEGRVVWSAYKDGNYKEADAFMGKYTGENEDTLAVNGNGTAKLNGADATYTDNGDGTINLISGGVSYTIAFEGTTFTKVVANKVVTFNVNGGAAIDPLTVGKGQKIGELPVAVKEGYNFRGWYESADFEGDAVTKDYVVKDNVTLNAKFVEAKVLTFDSKGGSAVEAMKVDENTPITAPAAPTKANHRFAGWYTDEDCTEGSEFNFERGISANTTVYAKWVETVTVTLYGDGAGKESTSVEVIDKGTAFEIENPSYLNADGTAYYDGFGGWFTNAECTEGNEFVSGTPIVENVSIYGKFTGKYRINAANYLDSLDTNELINDIWMQYSSSDAKYTWNLLKEDDNTIGLVNSNSGKKSSTCTLRIEFKEDTVFSFHYEAGTEYGNGSYGDHFLVRVRDSRNGSYISSATLDVCGADKSGNYSRTFTAGQNVELTYQKDSSTDSNGDFVKIFFDENSIKATQKFDVTYNFNYEGATEATIAKVTENTAATAPVNPTRDGFMFAGWYTEAACNTMYDFTSLVTKNVDLYAKWVDAANMPTNGTYKGYNLYSTGTEEKLAVALDRTFTIADGNAAGKANSTASAITAYGDGFRYNSEKSYFYYEPTLGIVWEAWSSNATGVGGDTLIYFSGNVTKVNAVKYGDKVAGSSYTALLKVTYADESVHYLACYKNKIYVDVTWEENVEFADIKTNTTLTVRYNGSVLFEANPLATNTIDVELGAFANDDAVVFAWVWTDGLDNGQWIKVENGKITVPGRFNRIILVRMAAGSTAPNWDTCYNHTPKDADAYVIQPGKVLTFASWGEGKIANFTWENPAAQE